MPRPSKFFFPGNPRYNFLKFVRFSHLESILTDSTFSNTDIKYFVLLLSVIRGGLESEMVGCFTEVCHLILWEIFCCVCLHDDMYTHCVAMSSNLAYSIAWHVFGVFICLPITLFYSLVQDILFFAIRI